MWLKTEQSGSVEQLPSRGLSWEQCTQNRRENPQMWAGEQAEVRGHYSTCSQRDTDKGGDSDPCKGRRPHDHLPNLLRGRRLELRNTFNPPPFRRFIGSMSCPIPLSSSALHSGLGAAGNLSRTLPSIIGQLHVRSACSSLCTCPKTLSPTSTKERRYLAAFQIMV